MPYSKAHYFVALIFVATIIGFWPSYFGNLGSAPMAFHIHGIIAMAWVLLVIFQSWTIHSKRINIHRSSGLASLILLPLLTGSLVMIANVSAAGYVEGGPYYELLGPVFGYATLIPFIAYLVLFSQALRHRRKVYLHAGYMLGTAFFMWEPAAARILVGFIPPLEITGPADFHKAADAIALGIVPPLLLAIYLYLRDRKWGVPFLVTAVFLALQIAGVYLIAESDAWRKLFGWYATLPASITVGTGVALGAAATWYGWSKSYKRASIATAK